MRGRVLLVGSMLTAIVVAVLTIVVLVLVEPELPKAEAIKTGVRLAVRSSRCMRYGSTTGVDAPMKRDTSWKATRQLTSASRVQSSFWATRPIRCVLVRFTHWYGWPTPLRAISRPCSTCSAPTYADRSPTPVTPGARMIQNR